MKKLTQEVFDLPECPEWAESAAVDGFGCLAFMNSGKDNWYACSGVFEYMGVNMESKYYQVEEGYDTTNWQQSAIDRGIVCKE